MKQKRIALMVPALNGGGAEKVAADLSLYFKEKGFKVIIFVEDTKKTSDYSYGGKIVYVERTTGVIAENSKKEFVSHLMKDANRYRELKKKYKIDITISFLQLANLLNILSKYHDKTIVTLHSVMSKRTDLFNTLGYGEKIFRYLYQLADKIVLVSQYCQKDWLEHYGDLFSRTIVIQNPINIISNNDYCTNVTKKEWMFSPNTIISVARLEGVKQQWHLIRSFKKVLAQCPDAELIIAGDGILKEALRNLSEQLGIDNHVYFIGFINNVEKYIQNSKVAVVTSASESWCNAIAEAMIMGVPIVTNDCPGGIRELMGVRKKPRAIKHNVIADCGIITPRLDGKKYTAEADLTSEESLLADGIILLLKNEKLRQEMSKKCVENARKYELQNIGQKWEEIIKTDDGKKVANIIGRLTGEVCSFLNMILNIRITTGKNNIEEADKNQAINKEKFSSYYNLLEQWMCLKEENIKIEKFFLDHDYKRVAIYGMAKIANHLMKELESSTVEIVYGIDRRADMLYGKFPIVSLKEPLSDVDVIVVTPIFDYENIKKKLCSKAKYPIVSMDEVIYYCAMG